MGSSLLRSSQKVEWETSEAIRHSFKRICRERATGKRVSVSEFLERFYGIQPMQTSPECRIPEDDCVENPSDVIVRWKGPGTMLANENCPSSPVVISWFGGEIDPRA
jgi:hypothetical protein